jgi:hypothetical protein
VLIALMLGEHWYPNYVLPTAIVLALYWWLENGPAWWRKYKAERQKKKQLIDDKPARDEFWAKHSAIRKRYDPNNEWNEATRLPPEYKREMAELNERYRDVMDRWHNQ